MAQGLREGDILLAVSALPSLDGLSQHMLTHSGDWVRLLNCNKPLMLARAAAAAKAAAIAEAANPMSRTFRLDANIDDEECDLPLKFAEADSVARLCVVKALQPAHLSAALRAFVVEQLGEEFARERRSVLQQVYEGSSPRVRRLIAS